MEGLLSTGPTRLVNVYATSGSENRRERSQLFTRDMFPHLLQNQAGLLPILAGDWNCLVSQADTTANYRDKYCKDLENLLKSFKFRDAYRILHPLAQEFTFHRGSCAPSRLDRVCLPQHLSTSLISHLPGLADHWGVEVRLQLELATVQLQANHQRTHWKLNSSILKDESFLQQFSLLYHQHLGDIN